MTTTSSHYTSLQNLQQKHFIFTFPAPPHLFTNSSFIVALMVIVPQMTIVAPFVSHTVMLLPICSPYRLHKVKVTLFVPLSNSAPFVPPLSNNATFKHLLSNNAHIEALPANSVPLWLYLVSFPSVLPPCNSAPSVPTSHSAFVP